MFNFLKKKKEETAEEEFELPPPPAPPADLTAPSAPEEEEGPVEFPEIKPRLEFPELEKEEGYKMPEFPEMPSEEEEMPGLPVHPTLAEPEFAELTPRKVFDRTIQEAIEKPEEIVHHQEVKPMFVAVEDFKNLAANTNFVRSKLVEAEEYLQRLTDLKNQELKAFEKWKKTLENVESKLSYVDKVIAEAQG
ncbi:hypothetical protein KY310_00400 [Candidatus Woesearchaeota archaeon]|nr:hypothetical protein [Candidatus Woesearchaeota archaeon]